jgi:hypothetical protein
MEPASLTVQGARAGSPVADPPAVLVRDGAGDPVAGMPVAFEVVSGGGSLSGARAVSGTDGVARVGSWTLGAGGTQAVRAVAPGLAGSPVAFAATLRGSAFSITLVFASEATPSQRVAFEAARDRIEQVVVGDLPDVPLPSPRACTVGGSTLTFPAGVVDDLAIVVDVVPIDGAGTVLARAGPCLIRLPSLLPYGGVMQFDTDDLARLEQLGQLDDVVLHEMIHVLGFGVLWEDRGLLDGAGTGDPRFTGARAVAAFLDANGGRTYAGNPVPVENTGNAGTVDSHWRDAVFRTEIMSGFLTRGAPAPLSLTTVASLADIGYEVDPSGADPFDISAALRLAPALVAQDAEPLFLGADVLRLPLQGVDERGRVVPVGR